MRFDETAVMMGFSRSPTTLSFLCVRIIESSSEDAVPGSFPFFVIGTYSANIDEMNNMMSVTSKLVENPRAVAIILGHLGATRETLEGYSALYHPAQPPNDQPPCSIVAAASPVPRFVLNQSLRPTARQVLEQTHVALQDTPNSVPVVVHVFSNGGAFLLEQMEQILQSAQDAEEERPQEQLCQNQDECDLKLIASRMKFGYQFFDSCPCYIRMAWDWEHATDSFPHPAWPSMGRFAYTAAASCSLTAWCTMTLSWHRPRSFWNQMLHSRICRHQIYMYSTRDLASDAAAVDRLIQQRRETLGESVFDCTVYRFQDSGHCRLLQDHPMEYKKAVQDALQAATERSNDTSATTRSES
jgi:hypothetical protein